MPYDWSNPYNSPIAYNVGNPQSVSITGISSLASVGSSTVAATGTATASITGISSLAAIGNITVSAPALITPNGIPSQESFGVIRAIVPSILNISGIPTLESFGSISVTPVFQPVFPVQITSSANSNSATFTSGITHGNFIVVCIGILHNWGGVTVTDTAGNLYTSAITNTDNVTNFKTSAIFYAPITSASGLMPTVTVAKTSGAGNVASIGLYEFFGVNIVTPIDALGVGSPNGSLGKSVTSTSMASTSFPNDLIIGTFVTSSTVSAFETGWTPLTLSSGGVEFLTATSIGAYAATFSQTDNFEFTASVASFRAALMLQPARMVRVL